MKKVYLPILLSILGTTGSLMVPIYSYIETEHKCEFKTYHGFHFLITAMSRLEKKKSFFFKKFSGYIL